MGLGMERQGWGDGGAGGGEAGVQRWGLGQRCMGKWELGVERQGCRGVRWWCTGGGVEESGERCMGIHSEDTEVGARWRDTGGIEGVVWR